MSANMLWASAARESGSCQSGASLRVIEVVERQVVELGGVVVPRGGWAAEEVAPADEDDAKEVGDFGVFLPSVHRRTHSRFGSFGREPRRDRFEQLGIAFCNAPMRGVEQRNESLQRNGIAMGREAFPVLVGGELIRAVIGENVAEESCRRGAPPTAANGARSAELFGVELHQLRRR